MYCKCTPACLLLPSRSDPAPLIATLFTLGMLALTPRVYVHYNHYAPLSLPHLTPCFRKEEALPRMVLLEGTSRCHTLLPPSAMLPFPSLPTTPRYSLRYPSPTVPRTSSRPQNIVLVCCKQSCPYSSPTHPPHPTPPSHARGQ